VKLLLLIWVLLSLLCQGCAWLRPPTYSTAQYHHDRIENSCPPWYSSVNQKDLLKAAQLDWASHPVRCR
jgi:hypothetical protein